MLCWDGGSTLPGMIISKCLFCNRKYLLIFIDNHKNSIQII